MTRQINLPAVLLWISSGIAAAVGLDQAVGGPLQITISGGLTSWFRGVTPDDALKRTDRLLYEAKNAGKDRILESKQ